MDKLKLKTPSSMLRAILPIIVISLIAVSCHDPEKSKIYPVDVVLDKHIFRSGEKGDNWYSTWGADGALYTAQCDGRGWFDENGEQREFKNTHVWRITGGPDSASFHAEMINFPDYSRTGYTEIHGPIIEPDAVTEFPPAGKLRDGWNWYGYGIVSIDGNLYHSFRIVQIGMAGDGLMAPN